MRPVRALVAAILSLTCVAVADAQEDYTIVQPFRAEDTGAPLAGLLTANDGNLYGAGRQGMFRLSRDGTVVLLNDVVLFATPIQGSDGYLYGTNATRIYRVALDGQYRVLADSSDGFFRGPLVQGVDGHFYGVLRQVGAIGNAPRIFRMTLDGTVAPLYDFPPAYQHDEPTITAGRDGHLYGTTLRGGIHSQGTLFRLQLDGALATLHAFSGSDGSNPRAQLLEVEDGAFYGATSSGDDSAVIFRVRSNGEYTALHHFSGQGIGCCSSPLIAGRNGSLYGAAATVIFSLNSTTGVQVLHRTNNQAESNRWGVGFKGLVEWFDGNIYGAVERGGPFSEGGVFRLNVQRSPCVNVVTLRASVTGTSTALYMTNVVKSETPAYYGAWFVSALGAVELWNLFAPAVTPMEAEDTYGPFGQVGLVGVFSVIVTRDGAVCAQWQVADTGGTGPTESNLFDGVSRRPDLLKRRSP